VAVQVDIANDARDPFDRSDSDGRRHRRIGTSKFAGVAPRLALTDSIATFPTVLMPWDIQTCILRAAADPAGAASHAVSAGLPALPTMRRRDGPGKS
jgi:hypothetical protein